MIVPSPRNSHDDERSYTGISRGTNRVSKTGWTAGCVTWKGITALDFGSGHGGKFAAALNTGAASIRKPASGKIPRPGPVSVGFGACRNRPARRIEVVRVRAGLLAGSVVGAGVNVTFFAWMTFRRAPLASRSLRALSSRSDLAVLAALSASWSAL